MAGDERLIDKDPKSETDEEASEPFYKSETFLFALKVSLIVGMVSSVATGLVITNMRLTGVEEDIDKQIELAELVQVQQGTIIQNVQSLKAQLDQTSDKVLTLDLSSAKGELSQALKILDTQSQNIDKQLATGRNGLISLARMMQGTRVWQDYYRSQFQKLFDDNQTLKKSIKKMRGIQEKPKEEPQYLEMDF